RPDPPACGRVAPVAGYRVGGARGRRRRRRAVLLESVGARTVGVQAARSVARPDPALLRAATAACLAGPCQEVVVSSALGVRAWVAAARAAGQEAALVAPLRGARLLARDPAAADALRAPALTAIHSTEGATTEERLAD